MSLDPAPGSRQRVLTFVTPKVGDILFYETKSDVNRAATPAYGTAHPDSTRFPNHKFVFARAAKEDGSVYHWFYAAERANQDDYNWEKGTTSLGGARFDTVTRTYVNLRSAYDDTTPVPAAAMPNVPAGVFTGYVFWDKEQKRIGDKELDSLFIVEQHVFIKRNAREKLEVDDTFGGNLVTIQTLITAGEFATTPRTNPEYWGIQSDGTKREYDQIDDNWYVELQRDLVPSDVADTGRTYDTTINFSWPGVLTGIGVDSWPLRDGGAEVYARPLFAAGKEAYSGPCKATITQRFYATAAAANDALSDPEVMRPERIDLSTPFFSISIPPTLHDEVSVSITPGTENPKYDYAGLNRNFDPTNPIDWPATVVASDEVRPFRGGYLRETVEVEQPSFPPPTP
jgi:hypothetical protein